MLQLEQTYGATQIVHVDWHTDQDFRVEDTTARSSFYGVGGVPHVVFDGINPVVGGGSNMYPTYQPIFLNHQAAQSQFLIETDVTWDIVNEEGSIDVRVEVAAGETIATPANKRVGAIVYVRNHHHATYGNWHTLALQRPLEVALTASSSGQVQTETLTIPMDVASWAHSSTVDDWTLNPIDWRELRVVGFVQDIVTKEILQSDQGLQPFDVDFATLDPVVQSSTGGTPTEVGATVTYSGTPSGDVIVTLDETSLPAGWDAEVVWNTTTYGSSFTIPGMTDGQSESITVRTIPGAGAGFGTVTVGAAPAAAPGWRFSAELSTFHDTPAILYVDDDRGENQESYYLDAITGAGKYAIVHEVETQLAPSAVDMIGYDAVVWSTGSLQGFSITTADQAELVTYLASGGTLFASSHGLMNNAGATGTFITGYLNVSGYLQDTQASTITGVPSDALGDGVNYLNSPPFLDLADTITPGVGAVPWLNGPSGAVAVRNDGGSYRTVFMSTAFEGLPTAGERDLLMGRILNWLVPSGAVDAPELVPAGPGLSLAQNVPNPFASDTRLEFTIPREGPVRLTVHDVAGRRVAELVNQVMPSGGHSVSWDGTDAGGRRVASGVYLLRLESTGEIRTKEMVRIR